MRTGLKNSLCMAATAMAVSGCGGLLNLAGSAAATFMLAPVPQTYRLTAEGMTVPADTLQGRSFPESLRGNIYVAEIDGAETLKHLQGIELAKHDIGNVKAALSNSLNNAGLLNNDGEAARYRLATVVTENRSSGFVDTTVTTHMQFALTDTVTGETVFKESVATPSPIQLSDDPIYKYRIGKAMEGSVRGNIRVLLDRLAQARIE